jgi:hypothetical protein
MAIIHDKIFKFTGYALEDLSFNDVVITADLINIASGEAEPDVGIIEYFYVEDVEHYNIEGVVGEVLVDEVINYVVDSSEGELKRFDLLLGEYSGVFNDALNGSHESDELATYKVDDRGLIASKYCTVKMNATREGDKVKVVLDDEYIKEKFFDFEKDDFDFSY